MLRYDGVYICETDEGDLHCLRFYPPPEIYGIPDPLPGTVIGMRTTPERLHDDLRWLGMGNANRFAVHCTTAYVSLSGNIIEFGLCGNPGYTERDETYQRFTGTVRDDSLDLETYCWNEGFETCPLMLRYFVFHPLPPDFEQANAPADDPNTEVCSRCGIRAFKGSCLKETTEGFLCRACDR